MTFPSPIHVAIIGGGIGGLTLAVGLTKFKHITFTIYEAAPRFAEIGAGIGFGANSVRAMALVSPDIQTRYDKILTTNGWESKTRVWFDFQLGQTIPAVEVINGTSAIPAGTPICSPLLNVGEQQSTCHRAHLLDELVRLLPDNVTLFGKRLADVDQDGTDTTGKVVLRFVDGSEGRADCVIACDGIHSSSRGLVLGRNHPLIAPEFTGKHAYRGLIDMPRAIEALGVEKARNRQMYIGKNGHILTFPIAKGNILNVVAFHESSCKVWDGEWVRAVKKEDMMKDFAGWGKEPKAILELLEPDLWALFQVSPSLPTYHKGRLALLGDSAHATTPHQGSGAGMAIEDAYVLHNLLGACTKGSEIEAAFRAYETVRMPRCRAVIESSLRQGRLLDLEDEETKMDLNKLAHELDTTTRYVWNIDLPGHLEQAMDVFRKETCRSYHEGIDRNDRRGSDTLKGRAVGVS